MQKLNDGNLSKIFMEIEKILESLDATVLLEIRTTIDKIIDSRKAKELRKFEDLDCSVILLNNLRNAGFIYIENLSNYTCHEFVYKFARRWSENCCNELKEVMIENNVNMERAIAIIENIIATTVLTCIESELDIESLKKAVLMLKSCVKIEPLKIAKKELNLFDSVTDKSVLAYKIVDASMLCPESATCVIKYADATRGRIAQICDWYDAKTDIGVNVHYHLNDSNPLQLSKDEVFVRRCSIMGANPTELASFIFFMM